MSDENKKVHEMVEKIPLEKKIEDSRKWIESVIGEKIEGDFQKALKDGTILCSKKNKNKI
jgi:hypothetical protein